MREAKLLPDAAFEFQADAIELKYRMQRENVILTTENEKVRSQYKSRRMPSLHEDRFQSQSLRQVMQKEIKTKAE